MKKTVCALVTVLVAVVWPASPKAGDKPSYTDPVHGWKLVLHAMVGTTSPNAKRLIFMAEKLGYAPAGKIVLIDHYDEDHEYYVFHLHPNGQNLLWKHDTEVILTQKNGSRVRSKGALFTESAQVCELWGPADCKEEGGVEITDWIAELEGGYMVYVRFPNGIRGIESIEVVNMGLKPGLVTEKRREVNHR